MCGRFSLGLDDTQLAVQFGIQVPFDLAPRYNIAPSQEIVIVRSDKPDEASKAVWGLVPAWGTETSNRIINARAETVAEKRMFKSLFEDRRCYIPVDSFYEWKDKVPYRVMMRDEKGFALAGIWDGTSCAIITMPSFGSVRRLHGRMPVVLERPREYLTGSVAGARDMLAPLPMDFRIYRVSDAINDTRNDSGDSVKGVGVG